MRRSLFAVCALLVSSCMGPSKTGLTVAPHPAIRHQAIINGTLDSGDPAVVELYYITSNGGGTCTGELIGPHTVMTAGHCTDLSSGGELSPNGPALVPCATTQDAQTVANGGRPSSGCNLATFVIFNNHCTSTQASNGTCESGLISSGDFIIADQLVNPGYQANVSTGNDNDIGLLHLIDNKLYNGGAEPALLTFNRSDEGAQCADLGQLKFVGYGITSGNGQISGVKYTVNHDVLVHDTWHNEEDGSGATQWGAVCGNGSGSEPTCSGDSGGPSFNSAGVIMAVTSLGDNNCSAYGQDTRVDAHASWIDTTMQGWGDPINGSTGGSTSGTTSSGTTTSSSSSSSGGTSGSNAGECQPCGANGSCSNGGTCVNFNNGVCTGGTCSTNADCASGDTCFGITDQSGNTVGHYCFPSSQTCPSGGTTTTGGTSSTTSSTTTSTGSGGTSSSTTSGGTTSGGSTTTTSSGGTTSGGATSSGGSTGASAAGMCVPCVSSCSNGGQCLKDANGGSYCSGELCHTDADCGTGNSCFPMVGANNEPLGSYCFPTSQACPATSTGGGSGTTGSGGTTGGVSGGGTGSSGAAAAKPPGGGSSGGCTSASAGDVLFALMALLPLVRRRRR